MEQHLGADDVRSRPDLAAFVRALHLDYRRNGQQWENQSLEHYLEALAAWIDDADGLYRNRNLNMPQDGDWTFLARALEAATLYE
ncbi:hypothetical protein ABT160_42355 [Streptomyces sp. NPDC001941]|uniref:DUF7660 family protein n=1 Tax=Streptomyces sp. NPDC001941 TaxID=3154659 RepID=UPI00331F13DB